MYIHFVLSLNVPDLADLACKVSFSGIKLDNSDTVFTHSFHFCLVELHTRRLIRRGWISD